MSNEEEEPSIPTDQERRFSNLEAKLDALSCFEALAHKFDARSSARPTVSQDSDLEEDFLQAENDDVFDPAESVISPMDETADLPYEDLFKDCEGCGPKVQDGVAKRIDNACTKKPAKEQFSNIQAKYLRPENCEYLKVPRVNPELWDDLLDKVKSRDVGFQAFQKGLIKGIVPVANLASKLVDAKKDKVQFIPVADAYDLAIDALTLLGYSVFEFSMKRREMLKSEVAPGFKSLCRESQPITTMLFGDELPQSIRDISQVKRMAAKSVNSSKRKSYGQKLSQPYNKRRNYGESRPSGRSRDWRNYSLNSKRRNYHKPHREQLSLKADRRKTDQIQV